MTLAVPSGSRTVRSQPRGAPATRTLAPGLMPSLRCSGVPTDLDDNVVRAYGLAHGRVDVKVCAVDATWSAQAFVVRLEDRS